MASRPVVRIVGAPEAATIVFLVDAVVVEDDTYMVLGADPVPRETRGAAEELLKRARSSIQPAPGTLVVGGGRPQRLHAIVHDLNEEPSWREEWVVGAIREVFREAEARELRKIALPLLGSVHGSLAPARFAELFESALAEASPEHLSEIWLALPPETVGEIAAALREHGIEVQEEGRA
ncbi:MAG: hypothetical protein JSV86_04340 [Gemmatimonadota bacterium]|nr:MAG: hypothetical protein JSV86_04340 [Gemmatimonadota bacterium]